MGQSTDKHVLDVAKEIRNYLDNHPNAADSAEGVMRWWLSQQRFEESMKIVQQALELLVAQGDVNKAVTSGCQTVYFNAREPSKKKTSNDAVN